jgi:hypothetical protein
MSDELEELAQGGRIVQLCPVAAGLYFNDGGDRLEIAALALVELADGKRDVLPIVYGWNGEPDLLRLWTPAALGDAWYDLCGLGDVTRPSVGRDPAATGAQTGAHQG